MATTVFSAGGPKAAHRSAAATGNAVNVSEKEALADFISRISRDETPFLSSIKTGSGTAILHEWQTDTLAAPVAGQVAEGISFATQAAAQAAEPNRTRLGNYMQINSKVVQVTGTKQAVDQAGVANEYAFQLKKRGIEMRRDQEFGLVATNQSSAAGGTRTFGGYQAWANVNVVNALVAPADYTAPTNNGGGVAGTYAAVIDADEVALSLTHVDTAMQAIYEQGGRATRVMLSPSNRRAFSARAQAAGSSTSNAGDGNVRRNIDEKGRLVQAVEFYRSDFGDLMIVPNYIMGLASTISGIAGGGANFFGFVYDPSFWRWVRLRPLQEIEVGRLGDSVIGQIVEEATLECRNPASSGLIIGLSGA